MQRRVALEPVDGVALEAVLVQEHVDHVVVAPRGCLVVEVVAHDGCGVVEEVGGGGGGGDAGQEVGEEGGVVAAAGFD